MKIDKKNGKVSIVLSEDEALVLFEWIHNFNEGEHTSLFQHPAEERILFDLEAGFEKIINEIFTNNYENILSKARERIGE